MGFEDVPISRPRRPRRIRPVIALGYWTLRIVDHGAGNPPPPPPYPDPDPCPECPPLVY